MKPYPDKAFKMMSLYHVNWAERGIKTEFWMLLVKPLSIHNVHA